MSVDVPPKETNMLGDGLFVSFDGYQFEIFAHDGIRKTNVVYMEPSVLAAFMQYIKTAGGAA